MTTKFDDITGVLLAGGQSRRMFPAQLGGGDKSLRDLAGKPMLAHVIDRLGPQVGRTVDAQPTHHVFDGDDAVIDDFADGNRKATQRHRVDADAQLVHDDKAADER